MTFLEARKILAAFKDGMPLPFLLALSGTPDQLGLYLRAHAARLGVAAQPEVLPFGTLAQSLYVPAEAGQIEIFLLMPWDLAPECDWRSGLDARLGDIDAILARAEHVAALLAKRPHARLAYLPAPLPPVCAAQADNDRLAAELTALATRLGARVLAADTFSMATYLASGSPIAGTHLSAVAAELAALLAAPPPGTYKVVATDADNTLWAGLVGEDGVDAVTAEPHGRAFRHFIYQGLLRRLKAAGILLAVVSRNDQDMVRAPLASGRMPLAPDDFVAIRAGYGAKSDHVRALADSLNLGLDAMVFVDDNPVELAEVAAALPAVNCLRFPDRDDELPAFCRRLAEMFDRRSLTAEDAERTEMYRRRLASQPPAEGEGLEGFLKGLGMVLTVRDRSGGDWERAHQLINKTNQFNLNGERLDEAAMAAILAAGGRLFTATLEDRTGSHGEILACLIEPSGVVRSLVLSCRVFQRRVEHAFLAWLLGGWRGPALRFAFAATERNEPARRFLADPAFSAGTPTWGLDGGRFLADHDADLSLFSIREEA